jgi:hypothetical protein
VAAAAAGIIVAVSGKDKLPDDGNGSMVASDEHGSDKQVAAADPGPADASTMGTAIDATGPAVGSAKVLPPTFGSDAPNTPTIGSNDPKAGSGSGDGSSGTGVTVEHYTDIEVISVPSGARIFVDGSDTGKVTPASLSVPKKAGKKIAISLRLKGYVNYTFKAVDAGDSSQQQIELVKTKTGATVTTNPGGGRNNGSGGGGRNNGSGNKTGSGGDPDGLMRP